MKIKMLTGLSCLTSTGCLLVGSYLAELWFICWAVLGMIILWISFRKKPGIWPISIILIIYIVFAVAGLLLGLSPYLITIGCMAAMALWDLVLLNRNIVSEPLQPNVVLLEKLHLHALSIAIGLGLLLSILSLNIHLHLPFGLVVGLTILAAYGIFRGYKYLLK